MAPRHHHLLYLVAVGAAAALVAGCSHSATPTSSATPTTPAAKSAEQHFIDTVNGLCDKLEPLVIQVTHGGSIDIPAYQYLQDWPAHQRILRAFDKSLALVARPASASSAAAALDSYVKFANRLDANRGKAAKLGEQAWRREVAAEKSVESDPAIAGLRAAGFADSCQAR